MIEPDIQHISNSLALFTQELTKEYYQFASGLKPDLSLNSVYSKYSFLFLEETLAGIRSELNNKNINEDKGKKLKYLLEALYAGTFGNRVKDLREKISVLESTGMIEPVEEEKIKYINSENHLYNNNSRDKREKIRKARCRFIDENLNVCLIEEFEIEQEFIHGLGYSDKIQMFNELSGIDLYKLNLQLKDFLNKTDTVYSELLTKFAKDKLGISNGKLSRHDIYYMMRGYEFDYVFPAEKIIKTAVTLTDGMGIDLYAEGRISFDIAPGEKKSPRAFCAPVSIPREIYLVLNPHGGVSDYSAFLHEMGHALHFAHVSLELETEYKFFGDNSVSEGFALVFDHLLFDKIWLNSFISTDSKILSEYLDYCVLKELLMIRRFAAKLEYEIKLNVGKDISGKREQYCDIFEKITKINYDEEEFLTDVDPYFYCARYLRAWMFQAELSKYLRGNFGKDWFLKKKSGDFLRDIWSFGQKYSADELLSNKKCGKLSASSLLDNIERMLNKS